MFIVSLTHLASDCANHGLLHTFGCFYGQAIITVSFASDFHRCESLSFESNKIVKY